MKIKLSTLIFACSFVIISTLPTAGICAGKCTAEKSTLKIQTSKLKSATRVVTSKQRSVDRYNNGTIARKKPRLELKIANFNTAKASAQAIIDAATETCPTDSTVRKTKTQRLLCKKVKSIAKLNIKIEKTVAAIAKIDARLVTLTTALDDAKALLPAAQADYDAAKEIYDACIPTPDPTPTPLPPTPTPTATPLPQQTAVPNPPNDAQ